MIMRTLELMLIITWLVLIQVAVAEKRVDCQVQQCGNLIIDYPFGIEDGCYLNESQRGFQVKCSNGVATLGGEGSSHTFFIKEIRLPNQVLLETTEIMAVDCRYAQPFNWSISIRLPEPFMVSSRDNRFRAMGCDTTAHIDSSDGHEAFGFSSQCQTQWMLRSAGVRHGGLGQCQIAVPEGSARYNYSVTNQFNYSVSACSRKCSYAFLADEQFEIDGMVLNSYVDEKNKVVDKSIRFPLVGEWVIKDNICSKGNNEYNTSKTCGENARCNYTSSKSGYNCYCNQDYDGNPYIKKASDGGCKKGGGNGPLIIALASGFALTATLGAGSYAYGSWAEKKLAMKMTSQLLESLASSGDSLPDGLPDVDPEQPFNDIENPGLDGEAEPPFDGGDPDGGPPEENPRDFKQQDLKKAMKVYQKGRRAALWARRRMVARANLANKEAVEIRKYIVQDRAQLEPFVKGVRTLSRTVIHANVARLLGISARESSLIYRPFSDQTLHDRLHSSRTDRPSWEQRLKIAVGTARGLAFAHSKGIYHGNVKSSNILLDVRCNCKVVDFGVVRLWRRNTLLNSSKGYVDPEYLKQNSKQLTSTMDVYSFGVVLVELITGQDPSDKAFSQRGRSLVMQFMLAVRDKQNLGTSSALEQLVDRSIWAEEMRPQLEDVADIATQCLEAKDRPKMLAVRDKLCKSAPQICTRVAANPNAANRRAANPNAVNPRAGQNRQGPDDSGGQNPQGPDDSGANPSENPKVEDVEVESSILEEDD